MTRGISNRGHGFSWGVLLLGVVLALAAALYGGPAPPGESAAGESAARQSAGSESAAGTESEARADQSGHAAHAAPAGVSGFFPGLAADADDLTAAELGLQLQALLGQHSVLAADMMRGRIRNDPDLAQAADAALGKNTEALGEAIGEMLGAQAKAEFTKLWAEHVTALFNYSRGLATGDQDVQYGSETETVGYERELARVFAAASNGRLKQENAEAGLRMHVDHLVKQAYEYAEQEYGEADQLYRQAYSHTFGLGKVLASSLLAPAEARTLNTPAWRLESELGRLLGEHAALLVAAMRAGVANNPDFDEAAATVNGNTRDIAAAIDTLFGPAAAKSFQDLWADHIDYLMAYTAAAAKDDDAGRTAATAKLESFEQQMAAFLDSATEKRLSSATLANALSAHDASLIREVDAYASKDYQQAHELSYTMYQHMFGLAKRLAAAFGATVATRLPQGAAQTGRGGEAAKVGRR